MIIKLFGHRNTIRLQKYDYSDAGWYFVTICTQDRKCLFYDIFVGATRGSPFSKTRGSPLNEIIKNIWKSLPDHHPVELDEFIIMPNHVHFIIHIINKGGSRPAPTLGSIIGLFKSECTKQIRILTKNPQFDVWQRLFYERIIRDEYELNRMRKYIRDNPINWDKDINNFNNESEQK